MTETIPDAAVILHMKPTDNRAAYDVVAQKSKVRDVSVSWPAGGFYYTRPGNFCDVAEKSAKILSELYGCEFVPVGSQDLDHIKGKINCLDDILNTAREKRYHTFEFNSKTNELEKYP